VTKSALLAIFGSVVATAAITLNFVFEETDPKAPPANPAIFGPEESPARSLTLKPEGEPKDIPIRPTFDVVRINPTGDAVMAGRAGPGKVVEIFDGGKKIGEVTSDERGEWVFVPSTPLPTGNRQLSLQMRNANGMKTASETNVILVVPARGENIKRRPSGAENQPLAIKVPIGEGGLLEVLQKPTPAKLDGSIVLVVDAIDYTEAGKLTVAGKAPVAANIIVYLNNNFIGQTTADENALWNLRPNEAVPIGKHTLRADQVDLDGKVVERREVVFARSVPLTDVKPGTLVMVEPGNSLWRIARKTYGSGFKFTVIYSANKGQIRNVDLIYPGQIFTLPPLE
tara:strand:- start:141 stop:1163 length:1023 start_codon:yes stop_codon:yes gene_type:complete